MDVRISEPASTDAWRLRPHSDRRCYRHERDNDQRTGTPPAPRQLGCGAARAGDDRAVPRPDAHRLLFDGNRAGSARAHLQRRIPGNPTGTASQLYDKLEHSVLPLYYNDRARWIWMMKQSTSKIGYYFNTHRMMRRYATEAYLVRRMSLQSGPNSPRAS